MTSFLLIISFLLHMVTFTAIYQLYKQTKLPNQNSSSQEIMELFEVYLAEIKEENNRLEQTLLDKEHKPDDEVCPVPHMKEEVNPEGVDDTYTTPKVDDDVHYKTSLHAKILQMHDQGMPNEEIARKLNSGKTEVDLIIKIHAKKSN
ncbi:DUF6115 domain-containing protein [Virgibacillus necropolis]|uniref:Swarming motility protein SwrB n=1 Tax=Virgibacillus necropolis TaxID=163877 RepID=A0A221MDG3_9BACI|nr:hypothetical protein [Virgibacillus necropolis]ASN05706.1 hypothetical protein CFK40_12140 [Virgibacillus necropolis]